MSLVSGGSRAFFGVYKEISVFCLSLKSFILHAEYIIDGVSLLASSCGTPAISSVAAISSPRAECTAE